MTETEEISEFKSPEMNFSYIYEGRRSFLKHFLVTTTQRWIESDKFAIKTPVSRKLYMKSVKNAK